MCLIVFDIGLEFSKVHIVLDVGNISSSTAFALQHIVCVGLEFREASIVLGFQDISRSMKFALQHVFDIDPYFSKAHMSF